jgi:uncharacterized protein
MTQDTLNDASHQTVDPVERRQDISFTVGGHTVRGWHYPGLGERFTGPAGRAAVVMAHGLAATKDSALPAFADQLAIAGVDVVVFDYRGFGDSDGPHRQVVSPNGQLADYRGAIAAARALPGVDPERIIVWGVSFSGGHALRAAAEDPRVAAVIALTPAPDGLASVRNILGRQGVAHMFRCALAGVRDVVAALRRRAPVLVPVVGEPGTTAALSSPGALEKHLQMAGATWRNEVAARIFLRVATYRPTRFASSLRVPVLMQIADYDASAPPSAAMGAGVRARAEIRHYPCDHFDVYPGQQWFESVISHQTDFLSGHFATEGEPDTPKHP